MVAVHLAEIVCADITCNSSVTVGSLVLRIEQLASNRLRCLSIEAKSDIQLGTKVCIQAYASLHIAMQVSIPSTS